MHQFFYDCHPWTARKVLKITYKNSSRWNAKFEDEVKDKMAAFFLEFKFVEQKRNWNFAETRTTNCYRMFVSQNEKTELVQI